MKLNPLLLSTLLLAACGGDGGPWQGGGATAAPTAPVGIVANAGDGAVSLGWSAPERGVGPFTYSVAISPATAAASIAQSGTTALVRGLDNTTAYTFSVTAGNSGGRGAAATVQATPTATAGGAYAAIAVQDDPGPSGIFDPALLRAAGGDVWMAYAGANDYSAGGRPVRDVAIRLARSRDGGQSFSYLRTLGAPQAATVTATGNSPCGAATCSGRWVYAAPWLVDDSGDPDHTRRFKLFASKYFLYPPATPAAQYQLGAIVLWTAAAPDGDWSAEETVLGWNFTPPELTPRRNVNAVDPALADCLTIGEGGATLYNGALDFVFACSYGSGAPLPQKIVMLRSTDHADSFSYVATLLQPGDAGAPGAVYFSASALLPAADNAPVLIATPVIADNGAGVYAGCVVIPFADEETGALFRSNDLPVVLARLPPPGNFAAGGCAWARGLGGIGLLMYGDDPAALPPFAMLATRRAL
jgi:hypothetical protein